MHIPVLIFIGFFAIAGTMVALIVETTRETCDWKYGETVNGQFVAYDDPVRECRSSSSDGSSGSGGSLRKSSGSNSFSKWFKK